METSLVGEEHRDTSEHHNTKQLTGFNTLPAELRDLIWESTLPSRRVFHVSSLVELAIKPASSPDDKSQADVPRQKSFTFHINHDPPVATSICQQSRHVALRHGFFFLSRLDKKQEQQEQHERIEGAVWFNPDIDVLYFDRNQRHSLRSRDGKPYVQVPGWERVTNVGVEWRGFFRDAPRLPASDDDMRPYWRAAVRPLYVYMPQLATLHYVLPVVRHKGGVSWGREPYRSAKFGAELVPLPEGTGIPWSSGRNQGGGGDPEPGPVEVADVVSANAARQMSGVRTWADIKKEMEWSMEVEAETEASDARDERGGVGVGGADGLCNTTDPYLRYPPRIEGWWLLRLGAPTNHENPQIREFLT